MTLKRKKQAQRSPSFFSVFYILNLLEETRRRRKKLFNFNIFSSAPSRRGSFLGFDLKSFMNC
jgi:hypothetical protein